MRRFLILDTVIINANASTCDAVGLAAAGVVDEVCEAVDPCKRFEVLISEELLEPAAVAEARM